MPQRTCRCVTLMIHSLVEQGDFKTALQIRASQGAPNGTDVAARGQQLGVLWFKTKWQQNTVLTLSVTENHYPDSVTGTHSSDVTDFSTELS